MAFGVALPALVWVVDLYVLGAIAFPCPSEPPLVVDPDVPEPIVELQVIARRRGHVVIGDSGIKLRQLSA